MAWQIHVGILCMLYIIVRGHAASPIIAQVPIPNNTLGYEMRNGSSQNSVTIEAIIDLNCPDSASAWPILKALAMAYEPSKVQVVLQMLPLPYHRNSMVTTQGFLYIQEVAKDKIWDYITVVFDNVSKFPTAATANMTDAQVLRMLSTMAQDATGVSIQNFEANVGKYREDVVTWWKSSVLRGVAGTPWYRINAIPLTQIGDTITLEDWQNLIKSVTGITANDATSVQSQQVPNPNMDEEPVEEHTAEKIARILKEIQEH